MHLFINALSASAGGGLTYLRNVIPLLAGRDDVHTTILLAAQLRDELPQSGNVSYLQPANFSRIPSRFWFEQRSVARFVRQSGADVLLSPGNFSIWNSPVPQILLSRNSLYTSSHFESDLRNRGESLMWIDTQLKKLAAEWSIRLADCTVAPSEAFAQELRQWTGRNVGAIHHGFDRAAFQSDATLLPAAVQEKLRSGTDAFRLLFVSHYNYYRNFETLFHAIPLIKRQLKGRAVTLFLTCKLTPGANPGPYRTGTAAALVRELGISNEVVELGSIPYRSLHHLYRAANVYVSPAYAESFAHPLVESMSSGLPVVASGLPVHKEICASAALYFDTFSPQELCERVIEIAHCPQLASELSKAGIERSSAFNWGNHIQRILDLARSLVSQRASGSP